MDSQSEQDFSNTSDETTPQSPQERRLAIQAFQERLANGYALEFDKRRQASHRAKSLTALSQSTSWPRTIDDVLELSNSRPYVLMGGRHEPEPVRIHINYDRDTGTLLELSTKRTPEGETVDKFRIYAMSSTHPDEFLSTQGSSDVDPKAALEERISKYPMETLARYSALQIAYNPFDEYHLFFGREHNSLDHDSVQINPARYGVKMTVRVPLYIREQDAMIHLPDLTMLSEYANKPPYQLSTMFAAPSITLKNGVSKFFLDPETDTYTLPIRWDRPATKHDPAYKVEGDIRARKEMDPHALIDKLLGDEPLTPDVLKGNFADIARRGLHSLSPSALGFRPNVRVSK